MHRGPAALTLSRVCKTFHRHAQLHVFRGIRLSRPHSLLPVSANARNIHRTLKAKPELGALCKSLDIFVRDKTKPCDYLLGEEIVRCLANVTSFQLQADYRTPLPWSFMKKILRNMPGLRSLTFDGQSLDLYLAPVCDIIETMQLQKLEINGVSKDNNRPLWALNQVRYLIMSLDVRNTNKYLSGTRTHPHHD
jgi:hypothetical protein